jgi:hypothetical protein
MTENVEGNSKDEQSEEALATCTNAAAPLRSKYVRSFTSVITIATTCAHLSKFGVEV